MSMATSKQGVVFKIVLRSYKDLENTQSDLERFGYFCDAIAVNGPPRVIFVADTIADGVEVITKVKQLRNVQSVEFFNPADGWTDSANTKMQTWPVT